MQFLKKIYSNSSLLVFIDQAIFSGANFLLTFLLARQLNLTDFGMYSYIMLITFLILSITNALIIQPFHIIISKKNQSKALGFITKFMAVFIISSIIFMCVLIILTQIKLPFFSTHFYTTFSNHIFSATLFIIGYLVQDFFRKALLALQKLEWVLSIDILFILVFPLMFYVEINVQSSLIIIGSVNIISSIPGLFYVLKNSNFKIADAFYLNYHLTHGKWLLSTSILQWLSSNFLVFVSGIYLGLEALGALRLVQSFFGVINVVLQTVENYFLPKIAQIFQADKTKAKNYLSQLTQKAYLIFIPILVVLFLFSTPIITLLGGEKYKEFGYVVKLISVLYAVIFYAYPIRISVRIQELNKIFFMGYVLSFISTLLSFHVLLSIGSLYGVVFGLVFSQIIMIIFWKNQLNKNKILIWK